MSIPDPATTEWVPIWSPNAATPGNVMGPASATDGAVALYDGTTGKLLKNSTLLPSALGNVVGPASATDDAIALYSGTTGKLIKNSSVLLSSLATKPVPIADGGTGVTTGLTQLNASNLTSGTTPVARMPANVAYRNIDNTFVAQTMDTGSTVQGFSPLLNFFDSSETVDNKRWRFVSHNAQRFFRFEAINDAQNAYIGVPITATRDGDVLVGRDISAARYHYEAGRTTPMGYWIDVPFVATNFLSAGGMNWVVAAGNVQTNRYTMVGKTMIWTVYLNATTISGTPYSALLAVIPGGYTSAAGRGAARVPQLYDTAFNNGMCFVASSNLVQLQKEPVANFTVNTGSTYVIFTIIIEVN